MNRGAVSTARVAHLYRQKARRCGAALALEALNVALDSRAAGHLQSPLLVRFMVEEGAQIARAAYRAIKPALQRETSLQQRRNAFYATRLARANGWGLAGQCPASHGAKTPAARTRVCRDAGGDAATSSLPACKTVPRPMVGVSDEP